MNFDWNEFLTLAQELSHRAEPAAQRTAISRAYYSAFHAACAAIKTNGIMLDPESRSSKHLAIWRVYIKSAKTECVEIGNRGIRLKELRTIADYRPDKPVQNSLVQRSLQDARLIIRDVSAHLPEGFTGKRARRFSRFVARVKKLFSG